MRSAPPTTMPGQGEDMPTEESTPDAGYEISIYVYADGTYRVKQEPLDEDEAQPEQSREGGQTFTDPKKALAAAAQIIQANPISNSEQAHFLSSYGQGT